MLYGYIKLEKKKTLLLPRDMKEKIIKHNQWCAYGKTPNF